MAPAVHIGPKRAHCPNSRFIPKVPSSDCGGPARRHAPPCPAAAHGEYGPGKAQAAQAARAANALQGRSLISSASFCKINSLGMVEAKQLSSRNDTGNSIAGQGRQHASGHSCVESLWPVRWRTPELDHNPFPSQGPTLQLARRQHWHHVLRACGPSHWYWVSSSFFRK